MGMAGFKQNANFDFLVGLELSQIQVNPYTIRFIFVEGPEINVCSEFDHFDPATGATAKYQAAGPIKNFTIQRLPGRHVTEVAILSDDEMKLVFDSGDSLMLLRTDPRYESITMNRANGVIVIM
jgi:hypothetical protein